MYAFKCPIHNPFLVGDSQDALMDDEGPIWGSWTDQSRKQAEDLEITKCCMGIHRSVDWIDCGQCTGNDPIDLQQLSPAKSNWFQNLWSLVPWDRKTHRLFLGCRSPHAL